MTIFFKAVRHDNRLTGPWRDVIGPIHPDDGDGDLSSGEWVLLDALEGDSDD